MHAIWHHRLNAVWHGSHGSEGSEGVQPGQRPNWWLQPVSDGEIARMMMTEQTVFTSQYQQPTSSWATFREPVTLVHIL